MRKVEARMIQAIRDLINMANHDGCYMKQGNTEVKQSHHGLAHTRGYQRIISVYLHGYEIAAIRPDENTVWVSDCGWRTATTKSRLNTIIQCLTRHGHISAISQIKGEWYQINHDAKYLWKGEDVFPLTLNADNWMLMQAEKIAA